MHIFLKSVFDSLHHEYIFIFRVIAHSFIGIHSYLLLFTATEQWNQIKKINNSINLGFVSFILFSRLMLMLIYSCVPFVFVKAIAISAQPYAILVSTIKCHDKSYRIFRSLSKVNAALLFSKRYRQTWSNGIDKAR